MPTLDLEALARRAEEMRSLYARRDARMQDMEQLFFMEDMPEPGTVPENARFINVPTAHQIVREYQTLLAYRLPRFEHVRLGDTERSKAASERVTEFLNIYWHDLQGRRFFEHLLWYLLVRGMAVVRVLYDPSGIPPKPVPPPEPPESPPTLEEGPELQAWAQARQAYQDAREAYEDALEEYRHALMERFPVRVDLIDPVTAYPDPADPPQFVFIRWQRTVSELKRSWPELDLEEVEPSRPVVWWEYWDDRYYAYWVEWASVVRTRQGKELTEVRRRWVMEPREHGMRLFPLVIDGAFSMPHPDPSLRYLGLLWDIVDVLRAEKEFVSQYATLVRNIAWAPLIYKGSRYPQMKDLNLKPLAVNPLDETEELGWLVPQAPLQFLDAMQLHLARYIERSAVAHAAMGRQVGRSAAQQAIMAAQARFTVLPYEVAMERILERTSSLLLRAIYELWQDEVIVVGRYEGEETVATIRPRDIGGNYMVSVKMQTPYYEETMAKLGMVERLLAMGLISRETAADILDIEQPQKEWVRRLFEEAIMHPSFTEVYLVEAFTRHWPEALPILMELLQRRRQQERTMQQAAAMGMAPMAAGMPGMQMPQPQPGPQGGGRRRRPRGGGATGMPRVQPNLPYGGLAPGP